MRVFAFKREDLPPPNIPGADILDRGVPEDQVREKDYFPEIDEEDYEKDKEIEKKPPLLDPDMILPYDPDAPYLKPNKDKEIDI